MKNTYITGTDVNSIIPLEGQNNCFEEKKYVTTKEQKLGDFVFLVCCL